MKSNNKTYHFAVFGDIHGRIALMYTLAFLYQNESGIKLSGILQLKQVKCDTYRSLLN